MKSFKHLISSLVLCGLTFTASAQFNQPSPTQASTIVTNIAAAGYFNLTTNACKIGAVQIAPVGTNAIVLYVYDNNVTNFTYTNAAYATLSNVVGLVTNTSISPLTGVTNIETNTMLITTTVTNGANTNQIPYRSFIAAPSTAPISLVNMINSKGISVYSSGSALVLITYRPND